MEGEEKGGSPAPRGGAARRRRIGQGLLRRLRPTRPASRAYGGSGSGSGRRFQKVRRRLGGAGGVRPRGSASPCAARVCAGRPRPRQLAVSRRAHRGAGRPPRPCGRCAAERPAGVRVGVTPSTVSPENKIKNKIHPQRKFAAVSRKRACRAQLLWGFCRETRGCTKQKGRSFRPRRVPPLQRPRHKAAGWPPARCEQQTEPGTSPARIVSWIL